MSHNSLNHHQGCHQLTGTTLEPSPCSLLVCWQACWGHLLRRKRTHTCHFHHVSHDLQSTRRQENKGNGWITPMWLWPGWWRSGMYLGPIFFFFWLTSWAGFYLEPPGKCSHQFLTYWKKRAGSHFVCWLLRFHLIKYRWQMDRTVTSVQVQPPPYYHLPYYSSSSVGFQRVSLVSGSRLQPQ